MFARGKQEERESNNRMKSKGVKDKERDGEGELVRGENYSFGLMRPSLYS